MANTLTINPHTIYDDGAVSLALDIRLSALARARREGRLRHVRLGRRVVYLGSWLIEWLEADGRQEVGRGK